MYKCNRPKKTWRTTVRVDLKALRISCGKCWLKIRQIGEELGCIVDMGQEELTKNDTF